MRHVALVLGVLVLTTGCIGLGGDDGDDTNNTTDDGFDVNESTNDTTVSDDEETWRTDERQGTVDGANLVVAQGGAQETFTVENGTPELALNVSADGGELEMRISPPGCEEGSCQETVATEGGNATYVASSPDDGGWTIDLVPADPGVSSIDYTLIIAQRAPEA